MKRKTIIIFKAPCKEPEAWGNLKKLCNAKGWKYNTISKLKLPYLFEIDRIIIYRVPFH